MWAKKSFTLTEVLISIAIVSILAALALPNYSVTKEVTLNREAKASLALIRAAEKIYRMENNFYYPRPTASGGETSDISGVDGINNNLKLGLPESGTPAWSIIVDSRTGIEKAKATRGVGGTDSRVWEINFLNDDPPTCTGGTTKTCRP